MAKKSKEKDTEPVTNCDQSKELVAICDQLVTVETTSAEEIDIAKLIVVVRGQQVLIDRDIAMLYKVETTVVAVTTWGRTSRGKKEDVRSKM